MFPDYVTNLINVSPNKMLRAEGIIRFIINEAPDIIIFTELFCMKVKKYIINALYAHHYYYDTQTLGETSNTKMNGGISIISKYPIVSVRSLLFNSLCSKDDSFANKGVIEATIALKTGKIINIYGVHLQAWEDCFNTRKLQIEELKKFINYNLDSFIIGDFNVIYSTDEYKKLIDNLKLINLIDDNNIEYTINANTNLLANGSTMSNDGSSETVDYIFSIKKINVIDSGTLYPKNDIPFDYNNNECFDLSDHYPIYSIIEY